MWVLVSVLLLTFAPESFASMTVAEFQSEMASLTIETNSIITQSVHALAFCLGWVAGSFR